MLFVDVKNDIAFRKIFGDEKKKVILLSFLNAILQREGNERIQDISINDPYQPPILPDFKATIVDVRARDFAGNSYLIEMQVADKGDMDKRVLFYTSKEYSGQISRGEEYKKLKPVIFIGVFDYPFSEDEEYLSRHVISNVKTGKRVIKDMDFYFIELTKFHISLSELKTITDKWIFFLKEAENLAFAPENLNDEGLKEAYESANRFTWTKTELDDYEKASIFRGDLRNVEETAEIRGEKKGRQEEKIEIAKSMLGDGASITLIIKYTGLSKEEIENL